MNIVWNVLLFVELIVCVMLIGVILIQRSKGQGVGLSFGAGTGEAIFGAQMGNVLTRATVVLAILFLVNTLVLSVLSGGRGAEYESVVDRNSVPPTPEVPFTDEAGMPATGEPLDGEASALMDGETETVPERGDGVADDTLEREERGVPAGDGDADTGDATESAPDLDL